MSTAGILARARGPFPQFRTSTAALAAWASPGSHQPGQAQGQILPGLQPEFADHRPFQYVLTVLPLPEVLNDSWVPFVVKLERMLSLLRFGSRERAVGSIGHCKDFVKGRICCSSHVI
ncbi:hypothetical protein L3X38_023309 [Prunus dulcis]|uniref:Uncharacterized protein n=1 Tax=Prunus dulcis TaxID=3755 RepID=A0AAD4VXK7_PRUDU|nr:hypothetical protein L3X38_023309 [Prunus dulcis]